MSVGIDFFDKMSLTPRVSADNTTIIGHIPSQLVPIEIPNYTPAQKLRSDQWWNQYANSVLVKSDINNNWFDQMNVASSITSGAQTVDIQNRLLANIEKSASLKEIQALTATVSQDVGGLDRAAGLVNWLGGGGIHHQTLLPDTFAYVDSTDFLDTSNITTEGTSQPYRLDELLEQLKLSNPSAHYYLVQKAYAKAKRVEGSLDNGYGIVNNPTVKKGTKIVQDIVGNAIRFTENALTTGAGTLGALAWIVGNWYWILGGTALVIGGIVYYNRKALTNVAMVATPQGRMLSAAMAASKPGDKQ